GNPQHEDPKRQQCNRIVDPVHRPEHHEQRDNFYSRVQPMHEGVAVKIEINRHQARSLIQSTRDWGVRARVPSLRARRVTGGARKEERARSSSWAKKSSTAPSKSLRALRINTTRFAYSATSHGVCVIITIAMPFRLSSCTSAIIRRCSR